MFSDWCHCAYSDLFLTEQNGCGCQSSVMRKGWEATACSDTEKHEELFVLCGRVWSYIWERKIWIIILQCPFFFFFCTAAIWKRSRSSAWDAKWITYISLLCFSSFLTRFFYKPFYSTENTCDKYQLTLCQGIISHTKTH